MERSLKIALINFLVSFAVLGIKYGAYLVTGSVALYSDALESIINVATALAVIAAIRIASVPPDAEHPYGHHKAEYLSAVLVGSLIIAAALTILHESVMGALNPHPITTPWLGLGISSIATVLNIGWGALLIREGARNRSASLVADGKHLMADVATSVAVLIGVTLTVFSGVLVLDSLIAVLVALHVLLNGWGVVRQSTSGLLDETVPPAELTLIKKTIAANIGKALEAHDLRTRHAGKVTFIEFHLVVSSSMSVGTAHDICDAVEAALKAVLPGAITTIHVEPEAKAKHKGPVTTA